MRGGACGGVVGSHSNAGALSSGDPGRASDGGEVFEQR
eukprot:gene39964-26527_t